MHVTQSQTAEEVNLSHRKKPSSTIKAELVHSQKCTWIYLEIKKTHFDAWLILYQVFFTVPAIQLIEHKPISRLVINRQQNQRKCFHFGTKVNTVIFIGIWETHWVMWRFHVTWETNSSTENALSDNINKYMNSHDFLQHCFLYLYITGLRKKAANHGGDTGGFVKLCNVKKSWLISQCHSTGHSSGQVQFIF